MSVVLNKPGASVMMHRNFRDCIVCRMFVLDGLEQHHISMPYIHIGLWVALYVINLFNRDSCDLVPSNQYGCLILRLSCLFALIWAVQVNFSSKLTDCLSSFILKMWTNQYTMSVYPLPLCLSISLSDHLLFLSIKRNRGVLRSYTSIFFAIDRL